ncbi:MAG: S41 family peptidase, partial [Phycisphaerales bacterium]
VDPDAPDGFTPIQERWLEPSTRRPRFTGPVYVLSGPVVMSSDEAFILMMKSASRATVVGARTQGASGNPKAHKLAPGITLFLPSWQALTPEGEPFEGVGIDPDVKVDADPTDFARRDPVLDRALELACDDD